MIEREAGKFFEALTRDKVYTLEVYNYQGNQARIYSGQGDGAAAEKTASVKKAIRTIVDRGIPMPPNLRIYCTDHTKVQNRAFTRDGGWNAVSYITLGPTALEPGDLQSISNSEHPGFTKGDVTCIHELGHALHAHKMGEAFLDLNANGGVNGLPSGKNGVQVSGYAGMSKKEYVAEVFTGLILGRTYSESVMAEYRQYNGPAV